MRKSKFMLVKDVFKDCSQNLLIKVYYEVVEIQSVKRKSNKYTLNQIGEMILKLSDRMDSLETRIARLEVRIDRIEKRLDYNNLKPLPSGK